MLKSEFFWKSSGLFELQRMTLCRFVILYFHLLSHVIWHAVVYSCNIHMIGNVWCCAAAASQNFNFPVDRQHKYSMCLEGVTSIFPCGPSNLWNSFFHVFPSFVCLHALLLCPPPLPLSSRCSRGDSSSRRASGNRDEPALPDSSHLF